MLARGLIVFLFFTALSAMAKDPSDSLVMVFKASDEYEYIKENLQLAITARGMLVSGELHISDMLNRTGKDLGFDRQAFVKAESIEFCSALMSHKMILADPTNLVICPFTIAVFIKTSQPDQVYVAYKKQYLAGNAPETETAVNKMLREIVEEALE